MSGQISEEAMLILMSIYGGIVLIICYDVVRILRRIFPAKLFRVIVEDAIYWTFASIFMFNIFLKYNYGNRSFWSKGYYVSTVGLNQKTIAKYIREQEAEDRVRDSINKREYKDPFRK